MWKNKKTHTLIVRTFDEKCETLKSNIAYCEKKFVTKKSIIENSNLPNEMKLLLVNELVKINDRNISRELENFIHFIET